MPVVPHQIQGPARFCQPFGQPFRPPVQPHQGRQTDGFPPGCGRTILFPASDESVAPGEGFRGQRLRKGLPGKFSQNIGIFFITDGESQCRQPLPAASSGVTAIIRRVRQKYWRQNQAERQLSFSDSHSTVCRFRAAWRTRGEAKRDGSLMADNLREGVAGWRFGTGCPAGRPVGDAGRARPRVGFRQPGRDGTGDGPVACTGIRRRHLPGGEGGFNLAQPPEIRQHVGREIHEWGDRPGVRVLTCPAQDLPHLPAGDGEWRMASGEWKFTTRYSLLATRHVHQPDVNGEAGCQTALVILV